MNTSLNDIATALTGSMPTDGSAAFTGPMNLNGQNLTGVGNLTAASAGITNLTAGTLTVSGQTVLGNVSVNGPFYASGSRIIVDGPGNSPSVTVWDTTANAAGGMYYTPTNLLVFGPMNGDGTPAPGPAWVWIDRGGDLVANNNIACNNDVFCVNLSASNSGYFNGNISVNGSAILNIISCNGTLTMSNSDIFMNGHWIRDCANILGQGAQPVSFGTGIFVNGPMQSNSTASCASLITVNGSGTTGWWFSEGGGVGHAWASTGGSYYWPAGLTAELKGRLPRSLTRDIDDMTVVDINAALVVLFDTLDDLSARLSDLEALAPA